MKFSTTLLPLSFFTLLLIAATTTHAQHTISVVDKVTQAAIPHAVIYETWNDTASGKPNIYTGETDTEGKYQLHEEMVRNNGSLTIDHISFQPVKVTAMQLLGKGYTLPLTPTHVQINEVVVSANKFEQQRKEIPRQIELIQSRDIAFANQQNTADLLQNTGQVFVQKSQMGGGSPVMRGFEANKVLMVIDGIRMNNAIYRGGHLQNILRIDQNMLQQAELFFGPGSVVYGSDALGGIMHFTTLQPRLSLQEKPLVENHLYYRFGSVNNESTVHYDLNLGYRKWAFVTAVSVSSFGDMRQGKSRSNDMETLGQRDSVQGRQNGKDIASLNADNSVQDPTAYKQIDVLQKIRFVQNNHLDHTLNLQLSTSTDVPRYDRLTEKRNGQFTSAEWYYGPETRLLAAYHLNMKGTSRLYDKATFIAAYQYIEESRHNRNFGSANKNHRNEFVHVASVNSDFQKILTRHEIRYGAEITSNTIRSNANREDISTEAISSQSTRYPDGGSFMTTAAAYLSHAWKISPQLILSEGLRYSFVQLDAKFNDKSFYSFLPDNLQQRNQAINGQLGLVYLPGRDWKLSVAVSSGFRAPNIDDVGKIFDSQSGTLAIIPNPDLKPENVYTAEAGIGKVCFKKIKLEANIYYTWITDVITASHVQVNGSDSINYNGTNTWIVQNQNANKAYVYGTSLTLAADVSKNISLVNTFNYTYGRVQTDNVESPLDHIPPAFGRSAVNVFFNHFKSEFFVLYNGWKRIEDYYLKGEDNEQYATIKGMPAWYTLNIRTSYAFAFHAKRSAQLQLGVENILDRNYRTFASGISAPGRNIYATLRVTF